MRLPSLFMLAAAAFAGWLAAYAMVLRECELIGGFYVGRTVYFCVKHEVLSAPPAKPAAPSVAPDRKV